jgi:hypothetical protein
MVVALGLFLPVPEALAHDDPIVTVRVLCNGFNVLDMDAVLGEISDSATIAVDRPVQGSTQIEAWVREQMDRDLRIEITEIGTPEKLADGYSLSWTARFSRQDWRKAGVPSRAATNTVVIRNGRIIQWNGSLGAAPVASEAGQVAPLGAAVPQPGATGAQVAEVFGVPLTLLAALGVVVAFASFVVFKRAH